jgi:hypothetical protein
MLATAGGLAAVFAASSAEAQYHDRNRNVSVRERPQPGYDPIGIPLGAFRAYGTLPVGAMVTDNVFALPDGQDEDDVILYLRPRLEVRSQWSQHVLNLIADVDNYTYDEFSSEDRTNVTLTGFGRVDIQRGFNAGFNVRQAWLEEPRTDASSPTNTLEPVSYEQFQLGGDLSKEFNRLRLSGGLSHYVLDYDNALANDGVTIILQNDRDHDGTSVNGRLDYALTPATAIFASVGASERRYDLQPTNTPAVLFSRDSDGQVYSLGANFDITNLIRGEVAAGYLKEDFADAAFSDIDGLWTSARVEWFPTPLATFEFAAQRSVTETGIVGAAGALTTTLSARVDYELRRNIIVTGQVSHRQDELEGLGRDDTGVAAALDVLYLVNQHVGAAVSFQHAQRDSSGAQPGLEFDQETLGLNLVLRY